MNKIRFPIELVPGMSEKQNISAVYRRSFRDVSVALLGGSEASRLHCGDVPAMLGHVLQTFRQRLYLIFNSRFRFSDARRIRSHLLDFQSRQVDA